MPSAKHITSLRIVSALFSITALIVLVPVGFVAIASLSPVVDPDLWVTWTRLWSPAALLLAVFNFVGGIIMLQSPRPSILRPMAVGAVLAVAGCPFLWMFLI